MFAFVLYHGYSESTIFHSIYWPRGALTRVNVTKLLFKVGNEFLDHKNPYLDAKTIKIGEEITIIWPIYVFGVMAAYFGSRMQ